MAEFLILSLVAPLAGFGMNAGHTRRGSAAFPGRSHLIGLLGSAIGMQRGDTAQLDALRRLSITVGVIRPSVAFSEYHTLQGVPTARIKAPRTRAEALRALTVEDHPVITRRDYRADGAWAVAIRGEGLQSLADAIRHPVYVPYLGRKSCALAAPMDPRIVEAATAVDALREVRLPDGWGAPKLSLVVSDLPIEIPGVRIWTEQLRDDPNCRVDWHHNSRTAFMANLMETT